MSNEKVTREQQSETNKKGKAGLYIAILLVAMIALGVVYYFARPAAEMGSKAYTVEVVNDAGETATYNKSTDAEFVGDALRELEASEDFVLTGSESEYGFYIEAVNGLTADYNKDGAYWAFYVNGEYAQSGIDTQPIYDKDTITLKYETN